MPRVVGNVVEEMLPLERQRAGVKEEFARVQKREGQSELRREDKVVRDLGRDNVQPQEEGHGQTGEGGRAQHGVDAYGNADRERPGEAMRRNAGAQQIQERLRKVAIYLLPEARGRVRLARSVIARAEKRKHDVRINDGSRRRQP